jgi:AraC-like DNA-binding protein
VAYAEQIPDARLAPWVECTWTLESDIPLRGYPVRPDGCLDLICMPGAGAQIVGAMTSEQRFDIAAGSRTFGIRFRPGMAGPCLGIAPVELTDRTIALADAWGGAARIFDEAENVQVFRRALATPERRPDAVELAIAAITAAHGDIDLDWVARQTGLSARQFRRRCLEASGLTPKHLCRVLRFRRTCSLAGANANWADIAAAAGYYDQSHLIRDFQEFTGRPPMSVFSKTRAAGLR